MIEGQYFFHYKTFLINMKVQEKFYMEISH